MGRHATSLMPVLSAQQAKVEALQEKGSSVSVSETLKRAWADVLAAGLPDHVQSAALVEAVRLHTGGATITTATVPDARDGKQSNKGSAAAKNTGGQSGAVKDDDFFAAIERETGVSVDEVEQVIFLKDGAPQVNTPRRKLGKSLKQQQITATTLIAVSRHFGLNEVEVSDKAIRDECQRLTVFDRNFASNVKGIPGILQTGDRTKVFKVRTAAIESFSKSIALVLGTDAEGDS